MRRFIMLLGLFLILITSCEQTGPAAPPRERTIAVHGAATLPVKPDRVAFSAGVESRDASPTTAFKTNAARVKSLLAVLKKHGVTEQQMQTSYLDLGTVPARGRAPATFKVSNSVTVVREDPAEIGDLIQEAVRAGANDVGGLRFFVADASAVRQQGLAQAFKDARFKAEVLAREAGATLGEVVSVTDLTAGADDELRNQLRSLGYVGERAVEPGEEQMHFAVTVVFALR